MSTFFGIVDLSSAHREDLENDVLNMYDAVRHYPHDAFTIETAGQMSYGLLSTKNAKSELESHLSLDIDSGQIFVGLGKLSNSAEIIAKLGIVDEDVTDGELIKIAFQRWGENCVKKLVGTWSFAIYDQNSNTFFSARDAQGYSSVYYYISGEKVLFSTTIKSILSSRFFERVISQDYLVSWLTTTPLVALDESIYKGLRHILPGHAVEFQNKELSKIKYWTPEKSPVQTNATASSCAKDIYTLLEGSIAEKLDSSKPIASMLSGGLDSGTVSYVAASLLQKKSKSLTTITHVPKHKEKIEQLKWRKNQCANEHNLALLTTKTHDNMIPVFFDSKEITLLKSLERGIDITDSYTINPNLIWLFEFNEFALKNGYGLVFSGEGGNGTISFTGILDELPWYFKGFRRKPQVWIKKRVKKLLSRNSFFRRKMSIRYYKMLSPTLNRKLINLYKKRIRDALLISPFFNLTRDAYYYFFHQISWSMRGNMGSAFRQHFGIEIQDPTSDQRIIEYCYTIPNEFYFNDRLESKQIIKLMMKGKLPDKVLYGGKKGVQSSDIMFRLQEEHEEIKKWLAVFREDQNFLRFFNMSYIEKLFQDILDDRSNIVNSNIFCRILAVGMFMHKKAKEGFSYK